MGRVRGGSNRNMHWKISVVGSNDDQHVVLSKEFATLRDATEFFKLSSSQALKELYAGKINGYRNTQYKSFRIERIK